MLGLGGNRRLVTPDLIDEELDHRPSDQTLQRVCRIIGALRRKRLDDRDSRAAGIVRIGFAGARPRRADERVRVQECRQAAA